MAFFSGLLNVLIVLCSIFMICLVLIQRGRGGGLAGAFGGAGGSSAFGTKAGDVFTRVTIITAGVWFLLAMMLVFINNQGHSSAFDVEGTGGSSRTVPVTPESGGKGKSKTGAATPAAPGPGSPAPATGVPAPKAPAAGTTAPPPAKTQADLPDVFEKETGKDAPPAEKSAEPAKTP